MRNVPLAHLIYAGLIGLAVLFLWVAADFPAPLSKYDIGPAVFPSWLAGIMLALIAVDVFMSRGRSINVRLSEVALALTFGLAMGGAVWLANRLGFFYVLPIGLFIGLWLIGSQRFLVNLVFSVAMPLILWAVFEQVLKIPLSGL